MSGEEIGDNTSQKRTTLQRAGELARSLIRLGQPVGPTALRSGDDTRVEQEAVVGPLDRTPAWRETHPGQNLGKPVEGIPQPPSVEELDKPAYLRKRKKQNP